MTEPMFAEDPEHERDDAAVSGAVEALLMIAAEPIGTTELAQAVRVPEGRIIDTLARLVAFYDETGRGFELREVGGGWRYYTREEHAELIGAYVLEGQQARLSQAALETLAVIAYHQPISRGRIAAVRGVNVDGVVRTLLARGLIAESGHDHESGAVVFATTTYFLERMGLSGLDELPPLAPHLPEVSELEAELSQLSDVSAGTFGDGVEPVAHPSDDPAGTPPEVDDSNDRVPMDEDG